MKTRFLAIISLGIIIICLLPGCKKDGLPEGLEWSVLQNPSILPLIDDKRALVYEIKVKNSSIDSYAFEWISVKNGSLTLQNLAGIDLEAILSVYHSAGKSLLAGETAILYLWTEQSASLPIPETLSLTIQFNRISDGQQYTMEMELTVDPPAPLVLVFPLKARRYATAGAPSNNSYHRRTINFLDEKFWTSQRFAVDFIGLDAGNRYRQGRQNANVDYFGYGDIVYSATAGEVVSVIDTIADNVPPDVPDIDPAALYRSGGNQLVVKVADGIYVYYGHLKMSSINLKTGDKIETGQPVGRLGNSGNSDAPQLHLQVMDGPDPLRSNAIPWVFDHFILQGKITGYDHANGMIGVNYLAIQREWSMVNFGGDVVVEGE